MICGAVNTTWTLKLLLFLPPPRGEGGGPGAFFHLRLLFHVQAGDSKVWS